MKAKTLFGYLGKRMTGRVNEYQELKKWGKERKQIITMVKQRIVAEGGELHNVSNVGILIRSPFPKFNFQPIYLKATCRYRKDNGVWYICHTEGETSWVWKSSLCINSLPVLRDIDSKVDNSVVELPRFISALLIMLILGAVFYFCSR